MKRIVLLLLFPCSAMASLIEWTGTGEQTYYWFDQAHPTATITILADQSSIHSVNISNTKTSMTYNDPDISVIYSDFLGRWSLLLLDHNHMPDYFSGDSTNSTPLTTLAFWLIYGPESMNPYDHLDQMGNIIVGNAVYKSKEFEFTPTEWSTRVIEDSVQVPEPATLGLLFLGLAALGFRRRLG